MGKQLDGSVLVALLLVALVAIGAVLTLHMLTTAPGPEIEAWIEGIKATILGVITIALFSAPVVLLFAFTAEPPLRSRQHPAPSSYRVKTTGRGIPIHGIVRVQGLTHNRQTAERLLWQCRQQNRQKGWDWIIDKVLYDLERDRRA